MLYRSGRPVLIIPNLAIHINREVNKGVAINNQVDLTAEICGYAANKTAEYRLFSVISCGKELGVKKEDILDFELKNGAGSTYICGDKKRHWCLSLLKFITQILFENCWHHCGTTWNYGINLIRTV